MSRVLDASVLVSALTTTGPVGRWAEKQLRDDDLLTTEPGLIEATNILRRLMLAGRMERFEADSAFRDLMALPLRLVPLTALADRIWALSDTLTSYDASYVAVAEALEVPLATLDQKLATATGPTCHFLLPD